MRRKRSAAIRAQLRKVARLPGGWTLRVNISFSQSDLRVLAVAGYGVDAEELREFVRQVAVAGAVATLRSLGQPWTYNDSVWVDAAGRAVDKKGRQLNRDDA